MHFNKGFAWLPILLIASFVIIAGGTYYALNQLTPQAPAYQEETTTSPTTQVPANTPAQTTTQTTVNVPTQAATVPQSPVSVPGMSKYTDSSFGFSFWYPSGWNITTNPEEADSSRYPGAVVVNTLTLKTGDEGNIYIDEVTSHYGDPVINDLPSTHSAETYACAVKNCGSVAYFFKHPSWMSETQQNTSPADVSDNTMGGLHILAGASIYDSIIPLSASNFVVLYGQDLNPRALEKTIVANDLSVATPISAAEQVRAIEFEGDSFAPGGNGGQAENSLSASPLSGVAPLTVTFTAQASAGDETILFGDGQTTNSSPYGCNPQTEDCSIGIHVGHTYTNPGTYKALLYRQLPSTLIGEVTVVVQ